MGAEASLELVIRQSLLALAKAHAVKRLERLGAHIGELRRNGPAVRGAVRMSKPESAACAALDDDFPAMESAVVCAAGRDEIVRVVTAAIGTGYIGDKSDREHG